MNRRGILLLTLLATASLARIGLFGQELQTTKAVSADFKAEIVFKVESAQVERNYLNNGVALQKLDEFINSIETDSIARIDIKAFTSPEGSDESNRLLAQRRADAMSNYITQTYPQIDRQKIATDWQAGRWIDMKPFVENDNMLPSRAKVLEVIESDLSQPTTQQQLRQIDGGECYAYIDSKILPLMRNATTCVVSLTTIDGLTNYYLSEPMSESFSVYFRKNGAVVDSGCMDNAIVLRQVRALLDDWSVKVDNVDVTVGYASQAEATLAERRATNLRGYFIWTNPNIERERFATHQIKGKSNPATVVVNYRKYIERDLNAAAAAKEQERLKALEEQERIQALEEQEQVEMADEAAIEVMEVQPQTVMNDLDNTPAPLSGVDRLSGTFVSRHATGRMGYGEGRRPLLALKTNLLYDIAITPNIELEIPFGNRLSLNMEWQYGWWLRKNNTFCWELESGGAELRFWFGDRSKHRKLTGWFAGVFAQGGLYDFQLKKAEGYQGEFYIFAGAGAGYSMPVTRALNIEFSLGVGYLVTDYRHYHVIDNELIKQGYSMRFSSILPAKAKVSLVWMLNGNDKKGGAR